MVRLCHSSDCSCFEVPTVLFIFGDAGVLLRFRLAKEVV